MIKISSVVHLVSGQVPFWSWVTSVIYQTCYCTDCTQPTDYNHLTLLLYFTNTDDISYTCWLESTPFAPQNSVL